MNLNTSPRPRILSGMRPTGRLHLGNLVGALQNWVKLQDEYDSFHFVADWHMLTTGYESTLDLRQDTWEMVADWLACGLDPAKATFFVQSRLPEHAELHLLFSMVTPLGWLERVPTYKEQLENIKDHDINTYGFLGYPLLQAADILMYKPRYVPVGEDQVPHVELTREVARRFNLAFGELLKNAPTSMDRLGYGDPKTYACASSCCGSEAVHRENYQRASLEDRAACLNRRAGDLSANFPRTRCAADLRPAAAGNGRPQDVEELRQRDFPDRRAGGGFEEARHHGDRSGTQAAHRPRQSRHLPGVRPAQDFLRPGDHRSCESRVPHGGNRLLGLQEACGRASECVSRAHSGTPQTLRAESATGVGYP